LYSVADIEAISKDMKVVFKQMFSGQKVDMDWTREKYKINLYDFSSDMYFLEAKGTGGYTIMNRRAVSDFIEIISTIDFGKETLLPAKSIEELVP
jgi:DNA mismatch repair ATPase MutL